MPHIGVVKHRFSYRDYTKYQICCKRIYNRIQRTFCSAHTFVGDDDASQQHNNSDVSSRNLFNPVNIQMLSQSLRQQIFKHTPIVNHVNSTKNLSRVIDHLKLFDLWDKKTSVLPAVDFKLPDLLGSNIDDHFRELASQQIEPIVEQVRLLCDCSVPKKPKEWAFEKGWTRYDPVTCEPGSVPYPEEAAMVFDVEVLMSDGSFPTTAIVLTPKAWYSWCSDRLLEDNIHWTERYPRLQDLIPLEVESHKKFQDIQFQPRVVIGHNVGFDRTFVREQYFIQGTEMRFLDTMSLHIAISGLTGRQRILYQASKTGSRRKEVIDYEKDQETFGISHNTEWMKQSTLNNLNDVYQLYCGGGPLEKSKRNVFVDGTMTDVRDQFQELMSYCASDVEATLNVLRVIWPKFQQRFPHPVTLSGMLEMGTTYLPINKNWDHYIGQSNRKYNELQQEISMLLQRLAREACELAENEGYKKDIWLWELDWTCKQHKFKPVKKTKKNSASVKESPRVLSEKQPHMPGFPKWYSELCPSPKELMAGAIPGPSNITTQRRITPKLLKLTWEGCPLHFNADHGWGYLVPQIHRPEYETQIEKELNQQEEDMQGKKQTSNSDFPVDTLLEMVSKSHPEWVSSANKADIILDKLHANNGEDDTLLLLAQYRKLNAARKVKKNVTQQPALKEPGVGPYHDILPGVDFYKLIHKYGENKRVSNPLAKDFLSKIEDGILRSYNENDAEIVLKCSKMCSYWKNNMDRIRSQVTVYLPEETPLHINAGVASADDVYGAILPRVVSAGTVTRRAVESTWLTASNAYVDRVGSELKAMIQTPPGYHLVGADVDSQELWIASILGDSKFGGIHGCTAFGWMTLQGNKVDGTDLHSRTAKLVGISRDHAKVLTYGRIYGAGVRFAEQLLRQFNPNLTQMLAKRKARLMYNSTKGYQVRGALNPGDDVDGTDEYVGKYWEGGSESHMFNKLEEIALSDQPRTPVLGGMISKTLEPKYVSDDFMTSRVNWAVQSSAVDYLHLMLVCMRWLFQKYNIDGRLCISIHDEVRYTVRSEDRYRAALALQITNLLTRCMFSYKLNMNDLPLSVAFFSTVDIDSCLRKEASMDCVTPSNPKGLREQYNIPTGEALNIYDILDKTGGSLEKVDK